MQVDVPRRAVAKAADLVPGAEGHDQRDPSKFNGRRQLGRLSKEQETKNDALINRVTSTLTDPSLVPMRVVAVSATTIET